MGLQRIVSADPVRNVLISMLAINDDAGNPVNPVTAALPVTVAFVPVGQSPDSAVFLAAIWVAAADGSFRARCQVGSGATGELVPGFYQPYVRIVSGGETITVPAADVLESY
jgi:hypothetical protein